MTETQDPPTPNTSDVKATTTHPTNQLGTHTATIQRGHTKVTRTYTVVADSEPRLEVTETGHYQDTQVYQRRLPSIPLARTPDEELVTDLPGLALTPQEIAELNGLDEPTYRLGPGFERALEEHGDPQKYYALKKADPR